MSQNAAFKATYPDLFATTEEDKEYYNCLKEIDGFLCDLNSWGKQEAVKRVEELTQIPKYQQTPPQAEARDGDNTEKDGEGS